MKHDAECLVRESSRIAAELAYVSEAIAAANFSRRQVHDRIAKACVSGNEEARRLTFWRCMSAAEIADLDAVHARTAPVLSEMKPRQAALKEALRLVQIAMEASRDEGAATRQIPGKYPAKVVPGNHPPKGGAPGTCRVVPRHSRDNPATGTLPAVTLSVEMGAQGELF